MFMNPIARRIIHDRYRRNYCMNNYTPPEWFECDVFELTPSGFFREYEIKTSRGDFFKDRQKRKDHWSNDSGRFEQGKTKHDRLAASDLKGPSRFYFVTPIGLIERNELPSWAGLIEWRTVEGSWPYNTILNTVVEAPFIHRCKFEDIRRRKLLECCYWRYHSSVLYKADGNGHDLAVAV